MPTLEELLGQIRDRPQLMPGGAGLPAIYQQQAKEDADKSQEQRHLETLQQLQKTSPGASVKVGETSVSPKPDAELKQAMRDQEKMPYHISKITSDYRKTVGDLDARLSAAKNVSDAIKQNNIQTMGQLKAQLPRLEGERFRPTDTERKLMLQPTYDTTKERLQNYFAGDNAAISDTQRAAIVKILDTKLEQAGKDLQRSRKEVLNRWKGHVRGMSPEDFEKLANSLGSTSEELLNDLQANPAPKKNPKRAPASSDPERDKLEMLRKKHNKKHKR